MRDTINFERANHQPKPADALRELAVRKIRSDDQERIAEFIARNGVRRFASTDGADPETLKMRSAKRHGVTQRDRQQRMRARFEREIRNKTRVAAE